MKMIYYDSLKPSTKPNQEKFEERETWHKLVVKIIRCKEGQGGTITSKEWKMYSEHVLETHVTEGKEVTAKKLKEIKEQITKNNGFA